MATLIEQALKVIEDNVRMDIENGEYFATEYCNYQTKSGIFVNTVANGNLLVHISIHAPKLVERLEKTQDLKEAAIYDEKAKTLRAKWNN